MPDAEALEATVARAVHAEQVGYDRFWVAEHHAVPGIASGTPAVLLAAIGARTHHIRIGSGGVMLPLHQPLVVAEQFLVLDALHPGRVDLGLGRSLGFTPPVRRALRRDHEDGDTFEDDLAGAARLPRGHRRGDGAALHRQAGADARARHRARAGGRRPARPARGRGWPRPRVRRAGRRAVALPPRVPTAPRQRAAGDGLPGRARRRRRRDRPRARPARGVGDGTLTSDRRVPAARGHRGDPGGVLARARYADGWRPRSTGPWPAAPRPYGAASTRWWRRTGADELLASSSTPDRDALLASDRMLAELLR